MSGSRSRSGPASSERCSRACCSTRGGPCRVERLLDDLWGDELPRTAVKMVQIYVSGLRKVLPADRLVDAAARDTASCSRPATSSTCDVRAARRRGSDGAAAGDPVAAAARLAATRWRCGAGRRSPSSHRAVRAPRGRRLEEMRLAAVEDRIDADLAPVARGSSSVSSRR